MTTASLDRAESVVLNSRPIPVLPLSTMLVGGSDGTPGTSGHGA
jgi:hypothetical protein